MSLKKILLAFVFLLAIYGASALDLSAESAEVCPTDTGVFIFTVNNAGNFQDSYTVTLSSDAARWAVSAPSGFSLKSGEFETVYVYVTPSRSALPGDYELKITVSSVSSVDSATALVTVKDCHSASFTSASTDAEVCSATSAKYNLELANTGKYTENFVLSLSGTAARWSVLSEELVRLAAGETSVIAVTATPPADQTGDFSLTVTAASQNSNAVAAQKLAIKSDACYGFSADADVNYVSFCENSEAKIPLAVENSGTIDNVYNIRVSGPSWATVEDTSIAIPGGEARFTNVVLFPSFGVSGDFPVTLSVKGEKGSDTATQEIIANVKSCYAADIKLSVSEDVACPNNDLAYTVSLANPGEFDSRFAISTGGAGFASTDSDFVDLPAGQSAEFNLLLEPKEGDVGSHKITVKAEAQDLSKASASAELDLTVASLENCFGVETTAALRRVDVAVGEPAVIPIIVENKGFENSTYNLEVSGTGAQFVQLNPASLTLDGKSARTVYAYIAVPEETAADVYKVTVAARLKDGVISSTTNFDIAIASPEDLGAINEEDVADERTAGIREAVLNFISRLREQVRATVNQITARVSGEEVQEAPEADEGNVSGDEQLLPGEIPQEEPAAAEEINETGESLNESSSEEANETIEISEETNATEETNETRVTLNESASATEGNETANETAVEGAPAGNETANETGESLNESAAQEQPQSGEITRPEGEEQIPEGTSQFLSDAVREKLASEGSGESAAETPAEEAEGAGESVQERLQSQLSKLTGAVPGAKEFLAERTYVIPNWLFILAVIVVVSGMSYALRRKDFVEKFNKFLEAEDEPSAEDKKNNKKPSAQDILDEAEKKKAKKRKTKQK